MNCINLMGLFESYLPEIGSTVYFLEYDYYSATLHTLRVRERSGVCCYAKDNDGNEYELLPEDEGVFWFAAKEDAQRKLRQYRKGGAHVKQPD